jgi:hypothetical protein
MAPEIFEQQTKDGSSFRCSDSYLRQWLHGTLLWSERRATRAAHKLPDDWEQLCNCAFLRIAYGIKEEDVPSELIVNSDQTQVVYAPGSKLTWTKTGSRQVTVIGQDEKRAFTVVVSVSNSGELLPFQAIYQGQSAKSCPSSSAKDYNAAKAAGFRFEFSKSKTYWSTQETMQLLVEKIIVPYFSAQKARLGLPESQKSIWQIDVWSVHRSEEFRSWVGAHHPNIILDFVPGGCTGVWQACDVGIQRIFKHSLKRSYHEDIVAAILKQIDDDVDAIELDKRLGILRDQSVAWLWKAHQTLNKPEIVKKVKNSLCVEKGSWLSADIKKQAFELCRTGNFNLSYASLTGYEARQNLRELKETNPEFWKELTQKKASELIVVSENMAEDEDGEAAVFEDDSDVPCEAVIANLLGVSPTGVKLNDTGDIVSAAAAESMETPSDAVKLEIKNDLGNNSDNGGLGRGKRKRTQNTLYNTKSFWRHNDNDASDDERS